MISNYVRSERAWTPRYTLIAESLRYAERARSLTAYVSGGTCIRGNVYSPRKEDDLVPLAGTLLLKLKVVRGPAALSLGEIGQEIVIVGRFGGLVDDNLGQLFVEGEDDVFVGFAQLEGLERLQTRRIDADAGCLWRESESVHDLCAC